MRQSANLILISSVLSFMLACSSVEDKIEILVLDQSIASQLGNLENAISKERAPVRFDNGSSASNCTAYLQQQAQGDVLAVTSERVNEAQYQDCAALAQLDAAGDLNVEIVLAQDKQASFATILCSKLDLASFQHSLQIGMTNTSQNAKEAMGMPPDNQGKDCAFTTADRHFELKPAIQFKDAKTSEHYLIVWLNDEILSGDYRDYQSLLVKMNSKGMWTAAKTSKYTLAQ